MYPVFLCEKMLLIIKHRRKGISKFPYTHLESFIITTGIRFYHFEKILFIVSGAHQISNWSNF